MTNQAINQGFRPARMAIRSAVFISHGIQAWSSEIRDISATGVLVDTPENWNGVVRDVYVLDMLIGGALNIHVEAQLVRVTKAELGFAYARIPEDKEIPLWTLLGGYADRLEPYPAT
jgi:hypothetical protein